MARASTRLYDAIDFAIDQLVLRKEDQKEIVKGLVILSDGGDNGSRICGDTVMMRVKKPGFPLFNVVSLGIFAKDEELDFLKVCMVCNMCNIYDFPPTNLSLFLTALLSVFSCLFTCPSPS